MEHLPFRCRCESGESVARPANKKMCMSALHAIYMSACNLHECSEAEQTRIGCTDPFSYSMFLQDYDTYVNVMYLHVALVFLLVAGLGVLTLTVDKVPKSRTLQKWVKFLHVSGTLQIGGG